MISKEKLQLILWILGQKSSIQNTLLTVFVAILVSGRNLKDVTSLQLKMNLNIYVGGYQANKIV